MTSPRAWQRPEVGYTYWVLRYVPDPLRGEFINIGVVVGSPSGEWSIRRIHDLGRATRLGGDASECRNWLVRLEHLIEPKPLVNDLLDLRLRRLESVPDPEWMERLRRQQENNFQISEPRPVAASSAEEAAERLFGLLVVSPGERSMPRGRTRAVRALREEFYSHLSPKSLQPDVRLQAGAQTARVDFAVGRSSIVQLSQVVAFDVKNTEHLARSIQGNSYALSRLRKAGGSLENPRRRRHHAFSVSAEIPIRALYVPPTTTAQMAVHRMAMDAWQDLGVRAFEHGDEASLVAEAKQLLEAG